MLMYRGLLSTMERVLDEVKAGTAVRDKVPVTIGIRWVDGRGNNRYFPKGVEHSVEHPFLDRNVTFVVKEGAAQVLVFVEIGLRVFTGSCSKEAYECTKKTGAWTLKSAEIKNVSLGFMRGSNSVAYATYTCKDPGGPEFSIDVNDENDP